MGFVDFQYFKLNLTEFVTHMLFFWTCMQFDDDQHNESEISDKDDVGASLAECVVDERVELDNDKGPKICVVDR